MDETGFLKKGNKSVGVQRQYSGRLCPGEDPAGPGTLPARVWADDLERRREAGVPEQVAFLGARRIIGWVTGDEVYLRLWLIQEQREAVGRDGPRPVIGCGAFPCAKGCKGYWLLVGDYRQGVLLRLLRPRDTTLEELVQLVGPSKNALRRPRESMKSGNMAGTGTSPWRFSGARRWNKVESKPPLSPLHQATPP